ncbi:hypothetical protein KIV45_11170 [Janthinobacterium lividum]|nr:hypothetical protein KIV45_11170 [Janthinobacterium lividum]
MEHICLGPCAGLPAQRRLELPAVLRRRNRLGPAVHRAHRARQCLDRCGRLAAGHRRHLRAILFSPSEMTIWPAARYLLVFGCVLQIAGLLSLNRSFGLVVAQRNIKTHGMYRFVRHPVYASYVVSSTAYLLSNASPGNTAVYAAAMLLLVLRLLREERFLSTDVRYRVYMRQVKYRLLPFIF